MQQCQQLVGGAKCPQHVPTWKNKRIQGQGPEQLVCWFLADCEFNIPSCCAASTSQIPGHFDVSSCCAASTSQIPGHFDVSRSNILGFQSSDFQIQSLRIQISIFDKAESKRWGLGNNGRQACPHKSWRANIGSGGTIVSAAAEKNHGVLRLDLLPSPLEP